MGLRSVCRLCHGLGVGGQWKLCLYLEHGRAKGDQVAANNASQHKLPCFAPAGKVNQMQM